MEHTNTDHTEIHCIHIYTVPNRTLQQRGDYFQTRAERYIAENNARWKIKKHVDKVERYHG